MAAEYEQYDRFKRGIWDRETLEYLDLPSASELGVETAVGYWNQIHFPTVVLQKGNQIIHATFYQVGEEALSLEEWVRSMAERSEHIPRKRRQMTISEVTKAPASTLLL